MEVRVLFGAWSESPAQQSFLCGVFAAACRLSRTEGELFERCRVALVRRFQHEQIWLTLVSPTDRASRVGPANGFEGAQEVARLGSGETEVIIHADAAVGVDDVTVEKTLLVKARA